MVTLQQLRVLQAVRAHGSLSRAAAALGYGVPTVAHHLRTLEAQLGAALVVRGRTGSTLTAIGEAFADDTAPLLESLARAERDVASMRTAGVPVLRLGMFASIGARLLPGALRAFARRSAVRVEVIAAEPDALTALVRDGTVHAGLSYDAASDPVPGAADLRVDPLLTEPYRVLAARSGRFGDRSEVDFTELCDAAWICSRSPQDASDRALRRVHRALGMTLHELTRTDDLSMIHGLVAADLGLAVSTASSVSTRATATAPDGDVVLLPTRPDLGARRVFYLARAGAVPPAVTWFGDILHTLVAEEATPSPGRVRAGRSKSPR